MKVGYARVSSDDQSLDIQIKELEAAGCERIYCEKVSGKSTEDRPELQAVVNFVREGDVVVVTKLDRLARNTLDTLNTVIGLGEKGVTFISLAEKWITTEGPSGKLILTIFAAFAEWERDRIKERQMAGIKAAREKGVYKRERKKRTSKVKAHLLKLKVQYPNATARELGNLAGCSDRTVYRLLPGQFRDKPDYLIKKKPPTDIVAAPVDDVADVSAQETPKTADSEPKRGVLGSLIPNIFTNGA